MGTITAAERASETRDARARFVAQISSLGSFADDVVGDLIRVEAGILTASESKSLSHAAKLLSDLADGRERPVEVWKTTGAQETFRQLSTFGGNVVASVVDDDGSNAEAFKSLSQDMDEVIRGNAPMSTVRALRTFFSRLASATMGAAQSSMLGRGTATSWLTR